MNCTLTLRTYKRSDGSEGTSLLLTTPNGTQMNICDAFGNKKLEYKIKCETKEGKK